MGASDPVNYSANYPAYPFMDVAVLDAVRPAFVAGRPVLVLAIDPAADAPRIVWADAAGADLIGRSVEDAIGSSLSGVAARQVAGAARALRPGRTARAMVRLMGSRLVPVTLRGIAPPGRASDDAMLVMLEAVAERARAADPEALAHEMLRGFGPGTAAAVFAEPGPPLAATAAFEAVAPDIEDLSALRDEVEGEVGEEGDRMVKRPLRTREGARAAGIARLGDDPPVDLVLVVTGTPVGALDVDEGAGEEIETDDAVATIEGAAAAVAAADEDARSNAPVHPDLAPLAAMASRFTPASPDAGAGGEPDEDDETEHGHPPVREAAAADGDVAHRDVAEGADAASVNRTLPTGRPSFSNAPEIAPAPAPASDELMPLRFRWRSDDGARFTEVDPVLLDAVGTARDALAGRRALDVEALLPADRERLHEALSGTTAFTARTVAWAVPRAALRVPVAFSAIPHFSADGRFKGHRGHGIVRLGDAVLDDAVLDDGAPRDGLSENGAHSDDANVAEFEDGSASDASGNDPAADAASGAASFEPTDLTAAGGTDNRADDRATDDALTADERRAFVEIGSMLGASADAESDAAQVDAPLAGEAGAEADDTARDGRGNVREGDDREGNDQPPSERRGRTGRALGAMLGAAPLAGVVAETAGTALRGGGVPPQDGTDGAAAEAATRDTEDAPGAEGVSGLSGNDERALVRANDADNVDDADFVPSHDGAPTPSSLALGASAAPSLDAELSADANAGVAEARGDASPNTLKDVPTPSDGSSSDAATGEGPDAADGPPDRGGAARGPEDRPLARRTLRPTPRASATRRSILRPAGPPPVAPKSSAGTTDGSAQAPAATGGVDRSASRLDDAQRSRGAFGRRLAAVSGRASADKSADGPSWGTPASGETVRRSSTAVPAPVPERPRRSTSPGAQRAIARVRAAARGEPAPSEPDAPASSPSDAAINTLGTTDAAAGADRRAAGDRSDAPSAPISSTAPPLADRTRSVDPNEHSEPSDDRRTAERADAVAGLPRTMDAGTGTTTEASAGAATSDATDDAASASPLSHPPLAPLTPSRPWDAASSEAASDDPRNEPPVRLEAVKPVSTDEAPVPKGGASGAAPDAMPSAPSVAHADAPTTDERDGDDDASGDEHDVPVEERQGDGVRDAIREPSRDAIADAFRDGALDGAEVVDLAPMLARRSARAAPVDTRLLDDLPLPVLVQDRSGLLHANPPFLKLTGYPSLAALEGAGGVTALFDELSGPEAASGGAPANSPPATADAGADPVPMRIRRADGTRRPVAASMQSVPWRGEGRAGSAGKTGGSGRAVLLSLRPLDERGRPLPGVPGATVPGAVEDRLASLNAVLDEATDGVVFLDEDRRIRSLSRSAEALLGFADGDVRGRSFAMLFAPESQADAVGLAESLGGDGPRRRSGLELDAMTADGRDVPLFVTIGAMRDDGGYCAVLRDVSEWRLREQGLRSATEAAEEVSRRKSRFLARVSHEIRTPLNAIIGFAEVMAEERLGPVGNPKYREYLADIRSSGRHVLDLVNDLLDIARIEAGREDLRFEAVDMPELVREALALVGPQAADGRILVRTDLHDVPPVVADRRSLKQVVLNVLANAVNYTAPGGQVIASVRAAEGGVTVRIRDTGVGMDEADIARALEPFGDPPVRVAASDDGGEDTAPVPAIRTKRRGGGVGLGLPLSKAMAEANRARFAISSVRGRGTLVELHFPRERVLE